MRNTRSKKKDEPESKKLETDKSDSKKRKNNRAQEIREKRKETKNQQKTRRTQNQEKKQCAERERVVCCGRTIMYKNITKDIIKHTPTVKCNRQRTARGEELHRHKHKTTITK